MLKKKILLLASGFILLILCSSTQFSSAPPSGYTGVNGYTFANCHAGFPVNTAGGGVTVTGLPTGSYIPGQSYPISVTISHGASNRARWGFALAARNAIGQAAGTFTTTNPNTTIIGAAEIGHNAAVVTSFSSSYTYTGLRWIAPSNPSANDLNLKFYSVGVAANSNGSSGGDYVYSSLINSSFTTLPVLRTRFSANPGKDYSVDLRWETANELNSNSFIIERSTDGQSFKAIDQVNAAGNSSLPRSYFYTDKTPPSLGNAKLIYRLKQVDNDQNYFYSDVVSIKLNMPKIFMGAPIPNVLKKDESTSLKVFVSSSTLFQILLTDGSGKKVFTTQYKATPGFNNISINTSGYNLASGTYFLYVQGGEIRQTERLIVQ
jgi:hypothetical protein